MWHFIVMNVKKLDFCFTYGKIAFFSKCRFWSPRPKYLKNHWPKLHDFFKLIYINKMCVLNQLDSHLKAEKLFFQTSNTKKCIFFIAEV